MGSEERFLLTPFWTLAPSSAGSWGQKKVFFRPLCQRVNYSSLKNQGLKECLRIIEIYRVEFQERWDAWFKRKGCPY